MNHSVRRRNSDDEFGRYLNGHRMLDAVDSHHDATALAGTNEDALHFTRLVHADAHPFAWLWILAWLHWKAGADELLEATDLVIGDRYGWFVASGAGQHPPGWTQP